MTIGSPDSQSKRLLALQGIRLRQILWVLIGAFTLFVIMNIGWMRYSSAGYELIVIVLLLLAFWLNARGRLESAAALMIVTLLIGLVVLTVTGQGLYDETLLAFPALLIFAGMFGSRRLLLLLFGFMVSVLLALYELDRLDIIASEPIPVDWRRPFVLILVLAVSGFFVWLLSSDLRRTLARLEAEKQALQVSNARIDALARIDTLTNLANRRRASDNLQSLLKHSRDNGSIVAVISIDLDNFKTINDSLGHTAGDRLLCAVADRLRSSLHAADTIARASGDQFLIMLGAINSEAKIKVVAVKIVGLFARIFRLDGFDLLVTASMGIAVAPRDGTEADTLLKHADMAMYRAKDVGRNTFRFFDPGMSENVGKHLRIAAGLRTALNRGELRLVYQPQFELHGNRIVGAEALMRWEHPDSGLIPPNEFIPIAERSGLIHEIGAWALRQACEDAAAWRRGYFVDLVVAVNVSAQQFQRENVEKVIGNALKETGLPPSALELELTESLLAGGAQLGDMLRRLSASGVRIAIDDFGTGYSNLGYLRRYALHRLKIDQSFVRGLCANAHDDGLVRAIIEMAHCLDLQVVAEGVEDTATLERLRAYGCEFGQGYHWSPALPPDAFLEFVEQHQAASRAH